MTREEAREMLEAALDRLEALNHGIEADEILEAIGALYDKTPDPITGLVNCGCGGKAKITEQSLNWLIKCVECGIQLEVYGGRGGAVWSWNRAMGWEDNG